MAVTDLKMICVILFFFRDEIFSEKNVTKTSFYKNWWTNLFEIKMNFQVVYQICLIYAMRRLWMNISNEYITCDNLMAFCFGRIFRLKCLSYFIQNQIVWMSNRRDSSENSRRSWSKSRWRRKTETKMEMWKVYIISTFLLKTFKI